MDDRHTDRTAIKEKIEEEKKNCGLGIIDRYLEANSKIGCDVRLCVKIDINAIGVSHTELWVDGDHRYGSILSGP